MEESTLRWPTDKEREEMEEGAKNYARCKTEKRLVVHAVAVSIGHTKVDASVQRFLTV